ncbi:hypothetical protein MHY01S_08400 [Meiothermus hypogaeus NBRC 106114]|uniref:Uncharacterized protein n=1 Tax=Meiothermus hypogaeus NBRC 106114 TaxID=1227553 RepID=A0A511QZ60_9DEIN|nr:hypothetical protein MHY01S_08400 [Meiothermus hypogaeus NBRC 106114]
MHALIDPDRAGFSAALNGQLGRKCRATKCKEAFLVSCEKKYNQSKGTKVPG